MPSPIYMAIFLIILSGLLWLAACATLFKRQLLAPALSYAGLFILSLARNGAGSPIVPINSTILIGWLCMTLVVMFATILQPAPVAVQNRGIAYMLGGAITGLAVGLLGFSFSGAVSMLYGIMVIAVAIGVFFGYLLFTNTPDGKAVNIASGHFFQYLLAKGFPVAITVMIAGISLVIILARNTLG